MERMIATAIAGARVAMGVGFLVAPGRIGRGWIGDDADDAGTRVVLRALGVRDLVLGAGLLLALEHGRGARGWAEAGALADGVDAVATLAAGDRIPRRGRWTALTLAVPGAAISAAIARRLDDGSAPSPAEQDDAPLWLPREPARH